MFASLALTKMDCNRIANYFLFPVLLGLIYSNAALYNRLYWPADNNKSSTEPTASAAADLFGGMITRQNDHDNNEELISFIKEANPNPVVGNDAIHGTTIRPMMTTMMTDTTSIASSTNPSILFLAPKTQMPPFLTSVDSFELVLSSVLVLLAFVQLCANLLSQNVVKMLK